MRGRPLWPSLPRPPFGALPRCPPFGALPFPPSLPRPPFAALSSPPSALLFRTGDGEDGRGGAEGGEEDDGNDAKDDGDGDEGRAGARVDAPDVGGPGEAAVAGEGERDAGRGGDAADARGEEVDDHDADERGAARGPRRVVEEGDDGLVGAGQADVRVVEDARDVNRGGEHGHGEEDADERGGDAAANHAERRRARRVLGLLGDLARGVKAGEGEERVEQAEEDDVAGAVPPGPVVKLGHDKARRVELGREREHDGHEHDGRRDLHDRADVDDPALLVDPEPVDERPHGQDAERDPDRLAAAEPGERAVLDRRRVRARRQVERALGRGHRRGERRAHCRKAVGERRAGARRREVARPAADVADRRGEPRRRELAGPRVDAAGVGERRADLGEGEADEREADGDDGPAPDHDDGPAGREAERVDGDEAGDAVDRGQREREAHQAAHAAVQSGRRRSGHAGTDDAGRRRR